MQDTTGDGESRSTPDQELSETQWVSQNVNILVLGDDSSCKARFISTFLGTGIDRDPSLENGFKKTVQYEDKSICVNINTNVGQESILGNCDGCVRQTQAAIFIYNICSRESFLLFGSWRDRLHREYEHMPIALVGCADRMVEDAHTREVTVAEARKVAESCSGAFFEIGSTENNPLPAIMEVFAVLFQRVTTNKKPGFQKPVDDPENTQQKYTELEIIVCGDVFVGKTQLVRQLLAMPYQSQYYATFDQEIHKHKAVIRDVGFILKVVDVGGLDLDSALSRDGVMTAQGFVLVYSTNSRDSFIALERLRKKILQNKSEARIPLVLVANKTDLVRKVSREEGLATAKRWSCPYFETCAHSASCHEDISECFDVLISDIQHIYAHVPLLDTIGEIDRQGYLGKIGNTFKTINRRYFSLKDCTLSYSNEIAQPIKDSIFLMGEGATTEPVNDPKIKEGFPFNVTAGEHRFALTASSDAERESWMTSIRANFAIADIANSILEEVMRATLWEACGKMPDLARRRAIPAHGSDEALLSTPPHHKLSQSLPSTPTASSPSPSPNLGGAGLAGSLALEGDDFMVPIVGHDLSSSPSASPPISRSPAQLAKSISFLRKHKK